MKKTITLFMVIFLALTLSGCERDEIEILPDEINVVYDNPRYVDGNFYIDAYITNGFESEMFVGAMDFGIYPLNSEIEVAGAGFNIDLNIDALSYVLIELEFGDEYVYVSENQLIDLGYKVEELELYFWLVE